MPSTNEYDFIQLKIIIYYFILLSDQAGRPDRLGAVWLASDRPDPGLTFGDPACVQNSSNMYRDDQHSYLFAYIKSLLRVH